MLTQVLRIKTRPWLRRLWNSASIPLPVAMLLGAILLPLLGGANSSSVFETLSKGFGNNLGYFAIVILSAFFIAGWIAARSSASFGKFGVSLSPLLGAGMVCPDTAYASLSPIAGNHKKYIAIGCYSGFKLLMPAGPLIIGIGLGANTHDPRFLYLGLLLTVVTWITGSVWTHWTTRANFPAANRATIVAMPQDSVAKVIMPLAVFFVLLISGYAIPKNQHPAIEFFTTPAGALIATSLLVALNSKPGEVQDLLSKAMRRTSSLLFTIGCASALGLALGKVLPKELLEHTLAPSDSSTHILVGVFVLAAIFKTLNGSSLATFAAIPPVLTPLLVSSGVDLMSITFAVCLGSFIAILPNDSYYWLIKSDAFPEYPTGRYIYLITAGSALQAFAGLAILLLISP
ncbi:arsinothricin export permease ArsQ [Pseudomonas aeruginosa]|uniref:arsinothricin export permease ArsQ n=1 Tax=Pseudomonas aeruginosa TaxID=287 RepID=UPI00157B3D2D|nr:arsinothricin export permease ArsQ [Pseudomonas aeruginosa]MDA3425311.1 permease [Pseudomonas aeruginosa]MDG3692252.1 arsinothricin export permease ArsQ [Pseudomonas aeruginosa]MDY1055273.1 arsinothricin export permease ArsQ [Pseudomonas aeruginosa]HBN9841385.1 permease [Pseudomonas aeruginosa]HBN9841940.1 permease [Pseudomonas aeruginosa]